MANFKTRFQSYVCEGDSISTSIGEIEITARIERDHDYKIDDDDSHNTDQTVTGCDDEQFEKLLKNRKAWNNDEWFFCGVIVTAKIGEIEIDSNSLWGIECNYPDSGNGYLTEVAEELLVELKPTIKNKLNEIIKTLESGTKELN